MFTIKFTRVFCGNKCLFSKNRKQTLVEKSEAKIIFNKNNYYYLQNCIEHYEIPL